MKITFLGGARTVTGSMHLVETEGGSILLECGLFQGPREEANRRNRYLPAPAKRADAVLLSHAHIDHSGALPSLAKAGWGGEVHLTPATGDLATVMLADSAAIQEKDAEFLNRHLKAGEKPVEPIYESADAAAIARRFRAHPYGKAFTPVPGVTARFADAGHILGSAVVHLTVKERAGTTRLVFTGDLGRKGLPLIRDPEPAGPADVVLSESTYGDRDHEPPEDTERKLLAIVDRTARRGGKTIVPAFAVGRAQALLYYLQRLRADGRLPNLPVVVDSPLAIEATKVFARHAGILDDEARDLAALRGKALEGGRTTFVSDAKDSRRINDLEGSAVIIAASGMCEAGRILHHLKHNLGDPRNTVLFVGFQAEHTLGRRLVEGAPTARIFGEVFPVRCEIARLNGLSAHADRGGIAEYLRSLGGPVRRVFLVHGDEARCEALKTYLGARGMGGIEIPSPRQTVDLAHG